ncbi:hypothetical protein PYCCODRAFT_1440228 [Trametes coccinea BRFM310]|uniref:Uncharacterized protein n=1 Tax=Trametes coccinea (strain BRFM310) TaxID=1353009 RepID=A0A1Y2I8A8_TRAC3|nr:hypothetical protein PYCCODRAFT_1440228 [Trametes coccinea BRFM310]
MNAHPYFEGDPNPHRLDNRRGILTAPIRLVNPNAVQPLGLGLNRSPSNRSSRPQRRGAPTDLDALVDEIWAQFAYDLIQISPNLKDERDPPYVTLTAAQRSKVTVDLYKQHSLPFRSVYYRTRDRAFWCQSFDKYFPPHGQLIVKAQNYPSCRYYTTWLRLRDDTSAGVFEAIRDKLRPAFLQLLWVPYNELDRIWNTRKPCQTEHAWTHLSDGRPSGVRILLNEGLSLRLRPLKLCLGRPRLNAEEGQQKLGRSKADNALLLRSPATRLDRTAAPGPSATGKPSVTTALLEHATTGPSKSQQRSGGSQKPERPSASEDGSRRPVKDTAALLGLRTIRTEQTPSPTVHSKGEGKRPSELQEGAATKRVKLDESVGSRGLESPSVAKDASPRPVKDTAALLGLLSPGPSSSTPHSKRDRKRRSESQEDAATKRTRLDESGPLVVHNAASANAAPPIPHVVLKDGRWELVPAQVIKKGTR